MGRTADWQLDRAYELETERELERAYASDDLPIIGSYFDNAGTFIGKAVACLIRAANMAEKFGFAYKIDSLIEQLDEIRSQVESTGEKLTGR